MIYFLMFILGLCVGSFLNVIIYRETIDDDEEFESLKSLKGLRVLKRLMGRSYCDYCKKKIAWHDNIPLLSFFLLGGKCRFCGKKISLQYPFVEFLTGIEFVWIYFLIKSNLSFFSRFEGFYSFLTLGVWLILGACFLAIFIADLKYQIIPDTAIIFGILTAFFKLWVDYRYTGMVDFSPLWSGLGAGLFFLILVLLTRGKGMGWGDVKLAVLMGMVLGFPKILIGLLFAFLTGAIAGVILVMTGKKKLKSKIAFGPFLIAGTIFSLIYGEKLWIHFS